MKTIVWFVFVLDVVSAAGDVIYAKKGQKATLNCGPNSYRRSLEWKHGNDRLVSVDGRGFIRKGTGDLAKSSTVRGTQLEISAVTEADAGKFTCVVDGTPQEHSLVVVSVSVSVTPSGVLQLGGIATLRCDVKGLDEGCGAKWKRPGGSSPTGSLTTELKPVGATDNGTWECIVTCHGKQLSESLTIKVQDPALKTTPPSNSEGIQDTPCAKCPNDGSTSFGRILGLSWWVWLVIGVGFLIVILLLVCVIVLCKRVRRRRRKFLQMKNAQQRPRPKKYCQCDHPTAAAKPRQGRRREKPSALPLHSV